MTFIDHTSVGGQQLPVFRWRPTQRRFRKYSRDPKAAETLKARQITERSLETLANLAHYRFLTTSMLTALVEGNERVTQDHLRMLFQRKLVNRFFIPRPGNPGEFIYYLDNPKALDLLVEYEWAEAGDLKHDEVRRNRDKGYHKLSDINNPKMAEERSGSALFIKHELMISHFHMLLELACRKSQGQVELAAWAQGADLHHRFRAPKAEYSHEYGAWRDSAEMEWVPHRPDAFFTLRFAGREGEAESHFFYEADRKTTEAPKFNRKLRSHFHFVVKQKRHFERYGVNRIRAVLVETLNPDWANHLRVSARHPMVSGHNPSALFWFTASTFFHREQRGEDGASSVTPLYRTTPEIIFKRIWLTPTDDRTVHSLHD